jgi:hypothetical protein
MGVTSIAVDARVFNSAQLSPHIAELSKPRLTNLRVSNIHIGSDMVAPLRRKDPTARYSFSFMAASLRPELARIVAEHYLEAHDWAVVKERILSSNALQARTASSAIRMERELRIRLAMLTEDQLILLATGTAEDRSAMAWLAAIKHISFAFEFASEVLREKLTTQDPVLRPSDYESFVEHKASSHPELVKLTNTSRYKVRQILLRMLTEAGLLTEGTALGTISRPVLSPLALKTITSDDSMWLAAFLVPDIEIGGA